MKWSHILSRNGKAVGVMLQDAQGVIVIKVRRLPEGGVIAQWCNGHKWVYEKQGRTIEQASRWFPTDLAAKREIDIELRTTVSQQVDRPSSADHSQLKKTTSSQSW